MTGLDPAGLRFVAFDFDGTLTDYVQADTAALRDLHAHCALSTPFGEFLTRAVDEIMAFHARVEAGLGDPLHMDEERLGRTLNACGVTCTPGHLHLYTQALLRATVPLPGAADLLTALRARGVPLALLSNAYDGPAQRARIHACFPEQPFDVIVIAGETGHLKPHPRPFQAMLDRLGLPAGGGVYVGASPTHDVEGAVKVGLPAFLVHPHARVQDRARQLGAAAVAANLDKVRALLALSTSA